MITNITKVDEAPTSVTCCEKCGRKIMKLEPRCIKIIKIGWRKRYDRRIYLCYKCISEEQLDASQITEWRNILDRNKTTIALNNLART